MTRCVPRACFVLPVFNVLYVFFPLLPLTICHRYQEYIWGNEDVIWTEMIRGKDINPDRVQTVAGVAAADIADQKKLGRIKIGMFDGRASLPDGNFEKIYTMSGRSFSIISTKTWETVYDSGSLLEETLRAHYPTIFNSEASDNDPQVIHAPQLERVSLAICF
jgi:hypothetical protein